VFAYTPDGETITAIIWWSMGAHGLHSFTYANVSEGVPDDLPQPGDSNIDDRIQTLINQEYLIPFGEELRGLHDFFHIEDPRPLSDHTFMVWYHKGEIDSFPSLVPGEVYGLYMDGRVGHDHEPNFPRHMDLEELGALLAGEGVVDVTCAHDLPERHDVIFCDMGALLRSQLASA